MNNKFKPGDLVKRRRFSHSRFGDTKQNYEIGIIIEFKDSKRLSVAPRALVLIDKRIVDTSTFFLDLI